MKVHVAFATAVAVSVATSATAATTCAMHRFPTPVEMDGATPIVMARINGREVRLLLDSGSFFDGVSAKFALEQRLKPAHADPVLGSHLGRSARAGVVGVSGVMQVSALVQADDFEFANSDFKHAVFMTLNTEQGGVLGQNFLSAADVEYDFKNRVMAVVTVRDCKDDILAYWARGAYSVLPLEDAGRHSHTVSTILINGRKMRAYFDTGAASTFITRRAAERAGVKITDPGVQEAGYGRDIGQVPIRTWLARFKSVKMDSEEITNGPLLIGDTEVSDFDILIGADFFLSHHVYVANSQGKIYFTYSGGDAFAPASKPTDGEGPGAGRGPDKPTDRTRLP